MLSMIEFWWLGLVQVCTDSHTAIISELKQISISLSYMKTLLNIVQMRTPPDDNFIYNSLSESDKTDKMPWKREETWLQENK